MVSPLQLAYYQSLVDVEGAIWAKGGAVEVEPVVQAALETAAATAKQICQRCSYGWVKLSTLLSGIC